MKLMYYSLLTKHFRLKNLISVNSYFTKHLYSCINTIYNSLYSTKPTGCLFVAGCFTFLLSSLQATFFTVLKEKLKVMVVVNIATGTDYS